MEGRRTFGRASWEQPWQELPAFQQIWRVASVLWAMALFIDAAARALMAYELPVDVGPVLAASLYPVTLLAMQLVTNVYFSRAGLYHMFGAPWARPSRKPQSPACEA